MRGGKTPFAGAARGILAPMNSDFLRRAARHFSANAAKITAGIFSGAVAFAVATTAGIVAGIGPAGIAHADSQPGESAAAKSNHCVGCHNIPGYRSVFPAVYPVPKIIGQSAPYIEAALRAYRDGVRTHPSMSAIAAQLSDEDIKELAEWYAGGAE
ncbi:MAG: c-type cytochrome [Gammaproteobacteria bacterium]